MLQLTHTLLYTIHILSLFSHTQEDADDEAEAGVEPPSPKKSKESSALESLLEEDYRPKNEGGGPQQTRAEKAEDEIKRYRAARPAGLQDNPLAWWRAKEKEYPLLAHIAKRYLCVPGTSIASERVFSTGGDIVTAKRSCLNPGHVNELLFQQKNLAIPM